MGVSQRDQQASPRANHHGQLREWCLLLRMLVRMLIRMLIRMLVRMLCLQIELM